jgi:hypothetical protein
VEAILTSPFQPKLESRTLDDGRSQLCIDTVWGLVPFNRPKLILGISITPMSQKPPPTEVVMFPAIIDTAFNRTLEIDERHLKDVLKSVAIPVMYDYMTDSHGYRRAYYKLNMNIWIHGVSYSKSKQKRRNAHDTMHLLGKTTEVRVMQSAGTNPWPPLPLLGLEALTANHIHIHIHSRTSTFTVFK